MSSPSRSSCAQLEVLARALLDADFVAIGAGSDDAFELAAVTARDGVDAGRVLAAGAQVARERSPVWIEELAPDAALAGLLGAEPVRWFAGAPIDGQDGRHLGFLLAAGTRPRAGTDLVRLDHLAQLAAHALTDECAAPPRPRTNSAARAPDNAPFDEGVWRSTEFLRDLLENLPVAVFAKSARPADFGTFVAWNRLSEEMFGLRTQEVLGKTDYDFFPKDQADWFQMKDRQAFELRTVTDIPEEPVDSKSLGRLTLHTIKVPVFDADGRPLYLVGIAENITGRKRVEARLNATMRRLELASQIANAGVWELEIESGSVTWDDTMYRLYGLPAGQAVHFSDWQRAVLPEDLPAALARVNETRADGERRTIEFRIRLADDSVRHIQAAFGVLRDDQGRVDRIVGVNVDITAAKGLEAEMSRARDHALQLARMKSEFLANMSHEIRTPMNAVIGLTGLLLESNLTEDQRTYLNLVQEAGNTLLNIISDILDISKLESGRVVREEIELDLGRLVQNAVHLLVTKAAAKGLTIAVAVAPELEGRLRGDPEKVRQVLLNLVTNAIKFTPSGRIDVTVTDVTPAGETARLVARIQVADTGIGLSAETVARLFQPFTQADASTTRRYGGTGLGLAICKRLVELLEGQIGVESEPGRGATFWVELPFLRPAPPPPAVPAPAPQPLALPKVRVLVVEDNPVNLMVAQRMLEKLGCQVQPAGDGEVALEALARDRFDLVFMDCQMPRMDGFEATARFREAERGSPKRTPVIALTANAMEGDRERCLAAGMDDYLSKPVTLEQMKDMVQRWLPPA